MGRSHGSSTELCSQFFVFLLAFRFRYGCEEVRNRILNEKRRKTYLPVVGVGSSATAMVVDFLFGRLTSSFPMREGAAKVRVFWDAMFKYRPHIDLGRPFRDRWPSLIH